MDRRPPTVRGFGRRLPLVPAAQADRGAPLPQAHPAPFGMHGRRRSPASDPQRVLTGSGARRWGMRVGRVVRSAAGGMKAVGAGGSEAWAGGSLAIGSGNNDGFGCIGRIVTSSVAVICCTAAATAALAADSIASIAETDGMAAGAYFRAGAWAGAEA